MSIHKIDNFIILVTTILLKKTEHIYFQHVVKIWPEKRGNFRYMICVIGYLVSINLV
jgi:hypothetical protein